MEKKTFMKNAGIALLVMAAVNLLFFFRNIGLSSDMTFRNITAVCMFGVIGAYLIKRAKDKEKEQKERDKWDHGK